MRRGRSRSLEGLVCLVFWAAATRAVGDRREPRDQLQVRPQLDGQGLAAGVLRHWMHGGRLGGVNIEHVQTCRLGPSQRFSMEIDTIRTLRWTQDLGRVKISLAMEKLRPVAAGPANCRSSTTWDFPDRGLGRL